MNNKNVWNIKIKAKQTERGIFFLCVRLCMVCDASSFVWCNRNKIMLIIENAKNGINTLQIGGVTRPVGQHKSVSEIFVLSTEKKAKQTDDTTFWMGSSGSKRSKQRDEGWWLSEKKHERERKASECMFYSHSALCAYAARSSRWKAKIQCVTSENSICTFSFEFSWKLMWWAKRYFTACYSPYKASWVHARQVYFMFESI